MNGGRAIVSREREKRAKASSLLLGQKGAGVLTVELPKR